jgi:hypothetical protein
MWRLLTTLPLFLYSICFGQVSATDYSLSLDFAPSVNGNSIVTNCNKEETNKRGFWVKPSPEGLKHLWKIGVPSENILKQKRAKVKSIPPK